MIRARVLTAWGQSGGRNVPQLALDYAPSSWSDVTGQPAVNLPPTPNLLTVELLCTQAVHDALAADAGYTVLWSEPV